MANSPPEGWKSLETRDAALAEADAAVLLRIPEQHAEAHLGIGAFAKGDGVIRRVVVRALGPDRITRLEVYDRIDRDLELLVELVIPVVEDHRDAPLDQRGLQVGAELVHVREERVNGLIAREVALVG